MSFFIKRRRARIEEFKKFPIETQNEVFFDLIEKAKYTEFGLKYAFKDINTIKDFQNRVPINDYEQLYPSMERVLKGEQNILWPSDIKWFSKSSGTTNARSKYIPVSEESLKECHLMGGKDMLTLYFENKENSQLFEGRSVSIGGSLHENPFNSETIVGDISAVMTRNLPKWADFFRIPPAEVALLEKWDEKMDLMIEACLNENVKSVVGVPTWTVVLLEKIMERMGIQNMFEIWPDFEVFFHGAVSFSPYRALFNNKFFPNNKANYLETYNASEGFFGIQDDFALKDQMLLMLDYGIFYEFVPLEELENEQPKALTLDEVDLDKNYAIIITTNSGLWRYKIGDTIKFTSKYPFRLKITGRTKQFINAFGEEVVVENADVAITSACVACQVSLKDYSAGPIYMNDDNKGGHEWIIECDEIPENQILFVETLDNKLREINSDYDAKRHKNMALLAPKVHFVKTGTFYKWMEKQGKLGGQHKVPRLANTREYINGILEII